MSGPPSRGGDIDRRQERVDGRRAPRGVDEQLDWPCVVAHDRDQEIDWRHAGRGDLSHSGRSGSTPSRASAKEAVVMRMAALGPFETLASHLDCSWR